MDDRPVFTAPYMGRDLRTTLIDALSRSMGGDPATMADEAMVALGFASGYDEHGDYAPGYTPPRPDDIKGGAAPCAIPADPRLADEHARIIAASEIAGLSAMTREIIMDALRVRAMDFVQDRLRYGDGAADLAADLYRELDPGADDNNAFAPDTYGRES